MKKVLMVVATLLIANNSFAEDASSTETKKTTAEASTTSKKSAKTIMQKLEDSPFSLSFYNMLGTFYDKDAGRVTGFGNYLYITPGYRTGKWSASLSNYLNQGHTRGTDEVTNKFSMSTLTVSRSGLIDAKKYGFNLTALGQARYYPYNSVNSHTSPYGLTRLGVSASKSFGKLNTSFSMKLGAFQRNTGSAGQKLGEIYPLLSVGYPISDKWYASVAAIYIKTLKKDASATEYSELDLQLSYQATKKLSVGGYIIGYDMGKDSTPLGESLVDSSNIYLFASYSMF